MAPRPYTPTLLLAALSLLLFTASESSNPHAPQHGAASPELNNCQERPYSASSPWNTPIASDAPTDERSADYIATLTATDMTLTSDVDQYTVGVYCVDEEVPLRAVRLAGYFSSYLTGARKGFGTAPVVQGLPIPRWVQPPKGSDGQVVILDSRNGVEYGFWQFAWANGEATATNGYLTRTDNTSTGVFTDGLAGRGGGFPYLGGLVRGGELEHGQVDHALAFAYPFPSPESVAPASKSDGQGIRGRDLPEGSRLQLDPSLTVQDLEAYGVEDPGLAIARALQKYGMYVVDNSGSAKVYVEDRSTALWDAKVNRHMLGSIPWTAFRVLEPSR